MDVKKIPIGTKFDLELINSIGERIGKIYISQLLDVIDSKNIIMSCPIHESRLTFIANGTHVRVVFHNDKHGLLSFTGIITEKEKTDNIIVLHTLINSDFEKIQRRNHFRLDCFIDGKYCILPEDTPDKRIESDPENKTYKKILAKNISGSGACIVSEDELVGGSLIELTLNLNKDTSIKTICKVIRSILMENNKDKKYATGLYFKEISAKDQDHLIKYIFKQQAQILKNNVADR